MSSKCVKCNEQVAIILIGTNGSFCRDCFEKYFCHKFRAALGKNPIVKHGDRVVVAYSGGNASSALLHVLLESLSPTAIKKLKFEIGVIFIDETTLLHDDAQCKKLSCVKELLQELKLQFHIIGIDKILNIENEKDAELNEITSVETLKSFFDGIKTLTSKEELLYRLRCKLLAFKAFQLGYKHVFLGETSTRLAINILSNIAQGRGAHLAADTRFTDEGRYFGINLLRPMRDISAKEIAIYNNLHKVQTVIFPTFSTKSRPNASIQRLTEDFIVNLSANFPATETTVFRTSNKLEMAKSSKNLNEGNSICRLCHGKLDRSSNQASALRAIDFTEKLSSGQYGTPKEPQVDLLTSIDDEGAIDMGLQNSTLCHCCKIIKSDLPVEIDTEIDVFERITSSSQKCTRRNLEEQLNGILIQENVE